jgi:hypothetical protein
MPGSSRHPLRSNTHRQLGLRHGGCRDEPGMTVSLIVQLIYRRVSIFGDGAGGA